MKQCTFTAQPSSVWSQLLEISNRVGYKRVIKNICLSSAWFKSSTFSQSGCDFLISLRWEQIMETGFLVQFAYVGCGLNCARQGD